MTNDAAITADNWLSQLAAARRQRALDKAADELAQVAAEIEHCRVTMRLADADGDTGTYHAAKDRVRYLTSVTASRGAY